MVRALLAVLVVSVIAIQDAEFRHPDRRRASDSQVSAAVEAEDSYLDSVLAELGSDAPAVQDADASSDLNSTAAVLLEAGAGKVHGYCEICIRILQMYQRGLPDVCAGLTDTFFISCVKNLESILKADRAVSYWHRVGCVHNDDGPEIVKPCPAHVICGWVPNIFARRAGVAVGAAGQLSPLCPRDVSFLPRVPRTAAPAGLPGAGAEGGAAAVGGAAAKPKGFLSRLFGK